MQVHTAYSRTLSRTCSRNRNQNWTRRGEEGWTPTSTGNTNLRLAINPEAAAEHQLCLQAGGQWPDFAPYDGQRATLARCSSQYDSGGQGADWLWDQTTSRFQLTDVNTGLHFGSTTARASWRTATRSVSGMAMPTLSTQTNCGTLPQYMFVDVNCCQREAFDVQPIT
jgi:hypothetical protein